MINSIGPVEDNRRHRRIEVAIPVQYRNLRKNGELPIETLTKNLSEGGVCFKSSEFMSLACRIILEISLPTVQRPIKAISKIAWIRKLPSGTHYEMGNQFLEMSKEDRIHVSNYMNNSLSEIL